MKNITIGNKMRPGIKLSAGEGKPTRIVASIGLSPYSKDISTEFDKARVAIEAGADIINDDSIVEPEATKLRELLIKKISAPLNTEPPILCNRGVIAWFVNDPTML